MQSFIVALGHLLWRSLTGLVFGWMATSLLSLGIGLINYWIPPYIDAYIHGKRPVEKPRLAGSVIVAFATWLLLFSFSVIHTVYADHVNLVSQGKSVISRIAFDDQKLQDNKEVIRDLQQKLALLQEPEAPDSLRRRTFKVADEFTAFLIERQKSKPPDAFPNSADPNPSEERKREIEKSQAYYRGIEDYYFKNFKDRFVGIIKEYDSKGVKTGYLGFDFAQRVPYLPPPGTMMDGSDSLSLFRDLSFHVDARDHLIVF